MFDDLKGKAVLITGASKGIGAGAARAFGACGARVGIHYNSGPDDAEEVAEAVRQAGGEASLFKGDFMKSAEVEAVVHQAADAFGGLDVLINNAGSMIGRASIEETTDAVFDELIDLNVRSVVAACRAVAPIFRKQRKGNIINVGSIAARTGGSPRSGVYASCKGFVSTLTRALALELVDDNIRVNAVAPGTVATPFQFTVATREQIDAIGKTIPMGRVGEPEDIAGAFLYLASDTLSGWVTGQIIEVNGGRAMP
jgi:3-oxoacyl-[acyl-carrier protein] reductase